MNSDGVSVDGLGVCAFDVLTEAVATSAKACAEERGGEVRGCKPGLVKALVLYLVQCSGGFACGCPRKLGAIAI